MFEVEKNGEKVEIPTSTKVVVTGAVLFALAVIVVTSVWVGGLLAAAGT